ncbi:MAG: hypothetical protein EHM12_02655 [Dehalococcoidia bacterium]|nr:MAG: hypothetical protein EHM12_02655 [Dehalococcoidia bacterium]
MYIPGQQAGHYESYFLRANHPNNAQAFWIRYTIFSPAGKTDKAIGELWAAFFDAQAGTNTAVKKEVPFSHCSFSSSRMDVKIDTALLNPGKLIGDASTQKHEISWDLSYSGNSKPLFLLPLKMYSAGFPKAKALVPLPMARFNGTLNVDGKRIEILNWIGSQDHNWGSKHTDLYAWGQVAGFDNYPGSFLEVATAKVKIGPFWTPSMTPIVLRHKSEEIALNSIGQTLKARGQFTYFDWQFKSGNEKYELEGRIWADRSRFAGLTYYNPPGGNKFCLNSKIASCTLKITYKEGGNKGTSELLSTDHRAAFEILTSKNDHCITAQV